MTKKLPSLIPSLILIFILAIAIGIILVSKQKTEGIIDSFSQLLASIAVRKSLPESTSQVLPAQEEQPPKEPAQAEPAPEKPSTKESAPEEPGTKDPAAERAPIKDSASATEEPATEEPVVEESPLDNFAKCLTEKRIKFYGAYWCGWCNKQKELFGESARYLPYIECVDKKTNQLTAECKEAGIEGFPTWELPNGEKTSGFKTLEKISELSGCPLE